MSDEGYELNGVYDLVVRYDWDVGLKVFYVVDGLAG